MVIVRTPSHRHSFPMAAASNRGCTTCKLQPPIQAWCCPHYASHVEKATTIRYYHYLFVSIQSYSSPFPHLQLQIMNEKEMSAKL